MIDLSSLEMPKGKGKGMDMEVEMEQESPEDSMAEESPLAGFSDEELMDEVKARGLI